MAQTPTPVPVNDVPGVPVQPVPISQIDLAPNPVAVTASGAPVPVSQIDLAPDTLPTDLVPISTGTSTNLRFQGATGPRGPQGPAGATGSGSGSGSPGATGATGTTGATGPTGATGAFSGNLTANVDGQGYSISNVATISAGNIGITGGGLNWSNASITQTSASDLSITGDGQVTVRSLDGTYQWTFDNAGNLTAPGNIGLLGRLTVNQISSDDSSFVTIEDGVDVIGNVTADYFVGDGSQLTGISSAGNSLVDGANSFVLDADGNVVFEGAVPGQAVNRGLVWDFGANVNGVNSQVRQDNSGLSVRAWTENSGNYAASVNIVTNQDANTNTWIFSGNGDLRLAGNLVLPVDGSIRSLFITPAFNSNITGITTGNATVIVTIDDLVFEGPFSGTVTISGVNGTTEADGVWDYQAVEIDQFQLFTDATLSTPVDGTFWTPYVSGGTAVGDATYEDLTVQGGNISVSSNDNTWIFDSTGNLRIPNNIVSNTTIDIDNRASGNIADIRLYAADDIVLQARDRPAGSGTEGGDINIYAGDSAEDGDTSGGDITIEAGRGGAGNVDFGGQGGFITIRSGRGGAAIGDGGATAESGGSLTLNAGDAGDNNGNIDLGATGGDVYITSGFSTGNTNSGGAIVLTTGTGGQNGTSGNVQIEIPGYGLTTGGFWTFDANGVITIPGEIDTVAIPQIGSNLTIATNDGGGLTGWSSTALAVVYNADIISTYAIGSTITWQDGTTATITSIDNYAPTYIDIFWDTPKTGDLFPITLKTADYVAAGFANANVVVGSNTWTFGADGKLVFPGTPRIDTNANNFEVQAAENISLEANTVVNIYTDTSGNAYQWQFGDDGLLTLPSGGTLYSQGSTPSGAPGNTIILQPSGSGTITNQKLMLYPTAGDGDHLHMVTGNLYETELFLGSDNFYVKLANTGNAVINTNDDNGNTAQWTFGADGVITLPNGAVIRDTAGNAVAFGLNAGQTSQGNAAVAIGANAGSTTQGEESTAVGTGAGQTNQGFQSLAVGWSAGQTNQGNSAVGIGTYAGNDTQGEAAVAVGIYAGETNQGAGAVAVGPDAGYSSQGANAVSIGNRAGGNTQGGSAVAIGAGAGEAVQGINAVAIGTTAGQTTQGNTAVAIGFYAGGNTQGGSAVAIGAEAGAETQGINAVAIGISAGENNQGQNAVAIGRRAGRTDQGNNSIILNATGSILNQTTANTFTVAPIRNDVANTAEVMFYNTASKEITYGNTISVAGNVTAYSIITPPTALGNLTAVAGGRAFVNDGNLIAAGNFGNQVGSGGSNTVPVWSDGTNWYVG